MLAFLRQLARAITGKVDPLEFSLGILFGLWLGLLPMREIDPGTGLLSLNGSWLAVGFLFLLLKASIPIAVFFAAMGKLLGMAFMDELAFNIGKTALDGLGPGSMVAGWQAGAPSLQLHTYWGFGSMLLGLVVGVLVSVPSFFVLKKRLPAWRERFGESKFAKVLSGFIIFRALRFLVR